MPLVLLALAVVARCGSIASVGADPDPLEGVVADAVWLSPNALLKGVGATMDR